MAYSGTKNNLQNIQYVKILTFLLTLLVFPTLFSTEVSASVTLDNSFNPEILREGTITAIAPQSGGKFIIAGSFIKIGEAERNFVARFNADGSFDETFNSRELISRIVLDIAVQPNGKIILVGRFVTYNGQGTNRIIRLNENGSLDETFNSGGIGANGAINSVQILNANNGEIVIGGDFTQYNGVARNRIARLNANGSLDTSFNPNAGANNTVRDLRIQSDGKIIIGGAFTTYDGTARNFIARLNSSGTLDTSFNPGTGFNSSVNCLELQSNGNILSGGAFTSFNGVTRNRIARISSIGSLDTSFAGSGTNGFVQEITIGSNDNIYLGGNFTTYNQVSQNGIVAVDANGAIVSSFNIGTGINMTSPNLLSTVLSIKEISSGNGILFGGIFQSYNGTNRLSLARVNSSGSLQPTFNSPVYGSGTINSVLLQPNGRILISGNFFLVNGIARNRIARLNSDGSLDNNFNAGTATDAVNFTARNAQPDGRIYVDGSFTTFNGVSRNRLARLNIDGSVDLTFNSNAGPNSLINDIQVQSDGKIIINGLFTTYNGVTRNRIARLNSDGSLDTSLPLFNPGTDGGIVETKFDNNGGILLVGSFNTCNGVVRSRICRINAATGELDTSFNPGSGANNSVYSIGTDRNLVVSSGQYYIGGEFTQFNGTNAFRFAKLQTNGSPDLAFNANVGSGLNSAPFITRIQSDGKIVVVGTFSSYGNDERRGIVRLNQNGTIDSSFNPRSGASDSIIYLALSSNNDEFFVVGDFSRFSGTKRTGIAKIVPSTTLFDFDGDGKSDISVFRPTESTWYLNRSSQGFAALQWGIATDKIAPADYDGDGKTDVAVWREGGFANFYVLNSADNTIRIEQFGQTGDVLTVGDWDGDGKADPAVYRDSSVGAQSYFYYRGSSNNPNRNVTYLPWGTAGDRPQTGDFDNDGKRDLAVFRPSNSTWYIRQSSDSQIRYENWGLSTDKFVPADYDGDGKTDLAVFRNGIWYIRNSSNNQNQFVYFGISTDLPVPADYDGDGKTDVAVFRGGIWYLLQSTNGVSIQQFGLQGDQPLPAAFIP